MSGNYFKGTNIGSEMKQKQDLYLDDHGNGFSVSYWSELSTV